MPTTIYLFRHGEAFQIGERGIQTDEERPLTPKGIAVTEEVCDGLRELKIKGDLIWHSPLVRAAETAAIISRKLDIPHMEEKSGLAYIKDEEALFLSLGEAHDQNIFLVGHQPQLGDWVCRLISGARHGEVDFSKSGVARVDIFSPGKPPKGELRWMLSARQLRKLA